MPGTTPIYLWPYPTGTDRVMDGDNAMEALARAIEASSRATDYADLAMVGGVSGATARVYRRLGVGLVNVNITFANGLSSGQVIGSIPVGYRPLADWRFQVHEYAGSRTVLTTLRASGEFFLDTAVGANYAVYGSTAFPLA